MHTLNKLQHVTAARAHDVRPHCRLVSPFYRTPVNTCILPETRFHKLHDSCYTMGLPVFNFTQLFLKDKKKDVQDEC